MSMVSTSSRRTSARASRARCSATRRTSAADRQDANPAEGVPSPSVRGLSQLPPRAQLAEECHKDIRLPRSVVAVAVHEERRRAVDAAACSRKEIVSNALRDRIRIDVARECVEIEAAALRIGEEMLVLEECLVFVQQVVHRPESVLERGCFGGA